MNSTTTRKMPHTTKEQKAYFREMSARWRANNPDKYLNIKIRHAVKVIEENTQFKFFKDENGLPIAIKLTEGSGYDGE